jgi:hypothetical protein
VALKIRFAAEELKVALPNAPRVIRCLVFISHDAPHLLATLIAWTMRAERSGRGYFMPAIICSGKFGIFGSRA